MSTNTQRRERFREVLAAPRCVRPASVFDALTARMAEEIGFELGLVAGSIAALAVLGGPDLAVLTLTELADLTRRIGRASALPLLVDADHGYGNALSVMRSVEELEAAGVAAMLLEDTLLPQPYAGAANTLISIEEGADKLRAAVAARVDPAFCIVARTSALSFTNLADAIARAAAYAATGVDAILFTGVKTPAELDALAGACGLPILLAGQGPEMTDEAYLASRGVRILFQSNQAFAAAMEAAYAALRSLRDNPAGPQPFAPAQAELLRRLSREAAYAERMERFLGAGTAAPRH
jgi:carboxyvinyl-carboxyphosphonate phosphorylmutase